MKKTMRALGLVMLVAVLGGQAVIAAEPEENCGGKYNVAVEVQQVNVPDSPVGASYCSDGTLEGAGVPQSGDVRPSTCADGSYPASVEADSGTLPDNPSGLFRLNYCSDGTLDELPQ